MHVLRDQACIVGIGETPYCRAPGSGVSDLNLILRASLAAVADAGLLLSDIDGLMVPIFGASGDELAANLGIENLRYAAQVNMGGVSPVSSLQSAAMAIATGVANCVLIPTGWNGYSGMRARDVSEAEAVASPMALPFKIIICRSDAMRHRNSTRSWRADTCTSTTLHRKL